MHRSWDNNKFQHWNFDLTSSDQWSGHLSRKYYAEICYCSKTYAIKIDQFWITLWLYNKFYRNHKTGVKYIIPVFVNCPSSDLPVLQLAFQLTFIVRWPDSEVMLGRAGDDQSGDWSDHFIMVTSLILTLLTKYLLILLTRGQHCQNTQIENKTAN